MVVKPIAHQVLSRLNMAQIEINEAGKIISNVIELGWGLRLKTTRIYEISNKLNLSDQKAHRNYANASQELQKTFILSKKNWNLKKRKKKQYFLMNLLFMSAQAFFTDGQKKIHAPKCPVMRRDVEIN